MTFVHSVLEKNLCFIFFWIILIGSSIIYHFIVLLLWLNDSPKLRGHFAYFLHVRLAGTHSQNQ